MSLSVISLRFRLFSPLGSGARQAQTQSEPSITMTTEFATLADFRALLANMPEADQSVLSAAADHNMQLTKPPGALGRLEDLALWYRSWRGGENAEISAPQVIVFAGNHGVAARGVSAFPPEVTEQMVRRPETT